MSYRTSQDNDITLYSYAELETMLRTLGDKKTAYNVPFNKEEIRPEMMARLNTTNTN